MVGGIKAQWWSVPHVFSRDSFFYPPVRQEVPGVVNVEIVRVAFDKRMIAIAVPAELVVLTPYINNAPDQHYKSVGDEALHRT